MKHKPLTDQDRIPSQKKSVNEGSDSVVEPHIDLEGLERHAEDAFFNEFEEPVDDTANYEIPDVDVLTNNEAANQSVAEPQPVIAAKESGKKNNPSKKPIYKKPLPMLGGLLGLMLLSFVGYVAFSDDFAPQESTPNPSATPVIAETEVADKAVKVEEIAQPKVDVEAVAEEAAATEEALDSKDDIKSMVSSPETDAASLEKIKALESEVEFIKTDTQKALGIKDERISTLEAEIKMLKEKLTAYDQKEKDDEASRIAAAAAKSKKTYVSKKKAPVKVAVQYPERQYQYKGREENIPDINPIEDFETQLLSAVDGKAITRNSSGKEVLRQVDDLLPGYGRIERIESTGCIIAGGKKVKIKGAYCQ